MPCLTRLINHIRHENGKDDNEICALDPDKLVVAPCKRVDTNSKGNQHHNTMLIQSSPQQTPPKTHDTPPYFSKYLVFYLLILLFVV
mmetsp:Transcript_18339/g.28213  ORF Transcript_18339/g.28213 Transcript_18339/m.28213 type:complete len:87 (+) Transcript_18339:2405-2665(+)